MNLELLDPFGRQIPDRVDATIQLAETLHPAAARDPDDDEWKSAYHVAYNRRGTYLAVGYGSGVTAVFSTLNRTLVALYPHHSPNGCSALSWTRRSRALLAGAAGDFTLRLYDTEHPYGPEEAAFGLLSNVAASNSNTNSISNISTNFKRGGSVNNNMEDEDNINNSNIDMDIDMDDQASVTATATATATISDRAPPPRKEKAGRSKNKTSDKTLLSTSTAKQQPKQAKLKQQQQQKTSNSAHHPLPKYKSNEIPPDHELALTEHLPFRNVDDPHVRYVKDIRALPMHVVQPGDVVPPQPPQPQQHPYTSQLRYPGVEVTLPSQTSGSVVQIHPRRSNGALAVLSNGALVLVWIPRQSFQGIVVETDATTRKTTNQDEDDEEEEPTGIVYTLYDENSSSSSNSNSSTTTTGGNKSPAAVTCAAFDPQGDRVYAALDNGRVLGLDVRHLWQQWADYDGEPQQGTTNPQQQPQKPLYITAPPPPTFVITNSNGVSVWHLVVSRNGKFLIVNAADGTIRVYRTELLWDNPKDQDNERGKNPVHVFQDVVTKVKFASTDVSGDGEYVVGGANGADNKYELYIWNTGTGALLDKLTGQSTQLYAVAWHPTRSFLAVACADGIVDIWGPRINWTAFAPDFQALPMNVEYIEREDEFDVDEHGKHLAAAADDDDDLHALGADGGGYNSSSRDTKTIDVTTIEPVPVFASDSEDEQEVFFFEAKLKNALAGFKTVAKKPRNSEDD